MTIKLDDDEALRGMYSVVCTRCRHYLSGYQCRAFDRIPLEIWLGEHQHKRPFPGDNGIRFEALEENAQ